MVRGGKGGSWWLRGVWGGNGRWGSSGGWGGGSKGGDQFLLFKPSI